MGVVYLAEHSLLGRKAAIALLPELSRNTGIVTRFFNEARATRDPPRQHRRGRLRYHASARRTS
jgi:hypothetical protein